MMQQPYTVSEQPAYRLDHASGHFLPANQAARDECDRWNAWARAEMERRGTLPAGWGQAFAGR